MAYTLAAEPHGTGSIRSYQTPCKSLPPFKHGDVFGIMINLHLNNGETPKASCQELVAGLPGIRMKEKQVTQHQVINVS